MGPSKRSLAAQEQESKQQVSFSVTPIYTPPKRGVLSVLPSALVPYGELMRIDRPAGFYAFYIPYLIGLGYAASIADPAPSPSHLAFLAGLFALGCVILRGAACAWNDNVDQDFDRKVERCQLRPIARGAITTTQGHLFTAALTLTGLPFFAFLPIECSYHVVPITFLFGVYALMKRITNYPQVVLGFPIAWGILMAAAALESDILSEDLFLPTNSLFLANVLWTIIYDTVYAHQDVKDDKKAGVKSMAVRFENSTKELVSVLALCQIGLLILTGQQTGLSPIYFLVSCGGAGIALITMISKVDLNDPASCAWFFYRGFWYVGGSIAAGLFVEWYLRLVDWKMTSIAPMLPGVTFYRPEI